MHLGKEGVVAKNLENLQVGKKYIQNVDNEVWYPKM